MTVAEDDSLLGFFPFSFHSAAQWSRNCTASLSATAPSSSFNLVSNLDLHRWRLTSIGLRHSPSSIHFLVQPHCNNGTHCLASPLFSSPAGGENVAKTENLEEGGLSFNWVKVGPHATEEQRIAISNFPFKMTKGCKALMRQIIYFDSRRVSLSDVLAAWVRIMKPSRADWLAVLKELKKLNHPTHLEKSSMDLDLASVDLSLGSEDLGTGTGTRWFLGPFSIDPGLGAIDSSTSPDVSCPTSVYPAQAWRN